VMGSRGLAVLGGLSESPQAPSALHPEFLLSWQKEPKARPRLQRPFGVPCAARKPRPDSNSLHSLRSLRSNSESESDGKRADRPRLGLLCCSALQDGATAGKPNSQQPGNGAVDGSPGCLAVGCLHLAVSAICTPPKHTAPRGLAKQASTTDPDSLSERSERSEWSEFESASGARALQGTPKGRGVWRSAFGSFWQDSGCRAEGACGLHRKPPHPKHRTTTSSG
jgi:hypothetical protein